MEVLKNISIEGKHGKPILADVFYKESKEAKPIIIFSHGFRGCATEPKFLEQAIADAGYIVFAPNHKDATCDGGAAAVASADPAFEDFKKWNDGMFRYRADDVLHLIAALRVDPEYSGRIDWDRVGLAGHSLGGYTMLGLDGAWPGWKTNIPGLKAILVVAPYTHPFVYHHTLDALDVPVMYQTGTRDLIFMPPVRRDGGAYDQTLTPKYYVEFGAAGHVAWTGLVNEARADIVDYSLVFLNHYVKGEPATPALTQSRPGVTLFLYDMQTSEKMPAWRRWLRALAGRL